MTADTAGRVEAQPMTAAWRTTCAVLAVAFVALLTAYFDTVVSMVSIWLRSGTFTHGFLIAPIAVFLVWRARQDLVKLRPSPAPLALIPLSGAAFLWLAASLLDVNAAKQFAWVAMIPALTWLLAGTAVARALLFPLGYLFFMVPFGEFLVPRLQDITATFTVVALRWSGIPVLWEGRLFQIPSGSFEVAAACSGVRYLIASIALGSLYAYLTYSSLARRWAFVALSVLVPIVANGIRAYGVVMLAHLSDHRLAVGVDHLIYGWFFFGLVIAMLFWIGGFFRDARKSKPTGDIGSLPISAISAARASTWGALGIAVCLSAPLAQNVFALAEDAQFTRTLPAGRVGWDGPLSSTDAWMPVFHGANGQQRGEYRNNGDIVHIYFAYYARQRQNAELINSENIIFNPERERRIADRALDEVMANGSHLGLLEIQLALPDTERVVWNWYWVDGEDVMNPIAAKLYEARARLTRSRLPSVVFAIAADYDDDPESARFVLRRFLRDMLEPLHASVGARS